MAQHLTLDREAVCHEALITHGLYYSGDTLCVACSVLGRIARKDGKISRGNQVIDVLADECDAEEKSASEGGIAMETTQYLSLLSRCSNCGGPLTAAQIALALADAGLGEEATMHDTLRLSCSSYTDERGCQGNDPTALPYWST